MRAIILVLVLFLSATGALRSAPLTASSRELRQRLATLAAGTHEAPLEELAASLRAAPTLLDDGSFALATFYETLTDLLAVDRPPAEREDEAFGLLARWQAARPDSMAAAILYVLVAGRQACRPSPSPRGFLRSESDIPAPLLQALHSEGTPQADPHAWVALLRCADELGWDDERRAGIVQRALASQGDYPPLAAAALMTQAEPGLCSFQSEETFLPDRFRRLVALAPPGLAPMIQARAAAAFDRLLGPELTTWYVLPLSRDLAQGVRQILDTGEGRGSTALAMARLSAILGERELAARALAAAGGHAESAPWIEALRTWTSGAAPLPPTWFRDPRQR